MSSDDSDPIDEVYDEAVDQTEEREGLAGRLLERYKGYREGIENGGATIRQIGLINIARIGDNEENNESSEQSESDGTSRRGFMRSAKNAGIMAAGGLAAAGAGAAAWEAVDDDGDTIYNKVVNNEYNDSDESSPPPVYTEVLDYRSELVVEEFFEDNEGILDRELTPSDIEIGENYLEGDFENGERLNYRQENSFSEEEAEYMASIEDEEDLEYAFKPLF